jgi:hypothetical protein
VVNGRGRVWIRKGVSGEGWKSWTGFSSAQFFQSVAAASYSPSRVDMFAIASDGIMYHTPFDGADWWETWNPLSTGVWDGKAWAASFSGHLGRMNVGGHQGGAVHLKRYSDWVTP